MTCGAVRRSAGRVEVLLRRVSKVSPAGVSRARTAFPLECAESLVDTAMRFDLCVDELLQLAIDPREASINLRVEPGEASIHLGVELGETGTHLGVELRVRELGVL